VPIFLENTCVLLMGVLSTFLVSWLGKEAMAGVGLADSFNMVVMSFLPPSISGRRWWWL
jgi:Na+-driven multidrug efflux pump